MENRLDMNKIQGKGLRLRPITLNAEDIRGFLGCHQDVEAKKNFRIVPETLAQAKTQIEQILPISYMFAVEAHNTFCGFVCLKPVEGADKKTLSIGFGIHPRFRRKGLASEAVRIATDYGFKSLGAFKISGVCRTYNVPSALIFQKTGYKLESILRKNTYINGRLVDDMLWVMER